MSRRFAPTAWKIAEVFCSSRNILESVNAKMKAAITLKNIKILRVEASKFARNFTRSN